MNHPVLSLAVAALLFSASPSTQAAPGGGLTLQLDTQYERSSDNLVANDSRGTQQVGLSIEAFGGGQYGGASVYVDAHFGVGLTGGFAYSLDFHPLGLALYDAKGGALSLGLTTGIHLQGVTGNQSLGTLVPFRLFLNFKIKPWIAIGAWASSELSLSKTRDAGSSHAGFGDELRTSLVLRVGKNRKKNMGRGDVSSGSGTFVGGTYSERLGISFWGIIVGHGMDMGGNFR